MKRFLLIASLLFSVTAFSSCSIEDCDEYHPSLYDMLVGRVWTGDLGFYQNNNPNLPLDSNVYFGADGFGSDELRFANNGQWLDALNITWQAFDDGTLWINYGQVDYPRQLRGVYIRSGVLSGDLFIDGRFYDHVELYMQ